MAKPNKPRLLTAVIFFCLICCESSAARPLNDLEPSNLAANEPAFNTAVPVKEKSDGASTALASHYRPCEVELMKNQREGTGKLGGIYGSLVMNVLPKGRTPASGPSRRNNAINV